MYLEERLKTVEDLLTKNLQVSAAILRMMEGQNNPVIDDGYLTQNEAKIFLKVKSSQRMNKLRKFEGLPFSTTPDGDYRYEKRLLRKWMEDRDDFK